MTYSESYSNIPVVKIPATRNVLGRGIFFGTAPVDFPAKASLNCCGANRLTSEPIPAWFARAHSDPTTSCSGPGDQLPSTMHSGSGMTEGAVSASHPLILGVEIRLPHSARTGPKTDPVAPITPGSSRMIWISPTGSGNGACPATVK